jgi:hypothetical protein
MIETSCGVWKLFAVKSMLACILFVQLLCLPAMVEACPICDPECGDGPLFDIAQTISFGGADGCSAANEMWARHRAQGWAMVQFPANEMVQQNEEKQQALTLAKFLRVAVEEYVRRGGELDHKMLSEATEILVLEYTRKTVPEISWQLLARTSRDCKFGCESSPLAR